MNKDVLEKSEQLKSLLDSGVVYVKIPHRPDCNDVLTLLKIETFCVIDDKLFVQYAAEILPGVKLAPHEIEFNMIVSAVQPKSDEDNKCSDKLADARQACAEYLKSINDEQSDHHNNTTRVLKEAIGAIDNMIANKIW
jgi:hypothetical protein